MIGFYFDEHIDRKITRALIKRGYQVIMAVDVGMESKDDDTEHLPYATENNLVMVTFDQPFAGRTMSRSDHKGLVYLNQQIRHDIGKIIDVLADFADLYEPERDAGQVHWLP
jgi:predicted nuclease of predicted toxin-antitoxin system